MDVLLNQDFHIQSEIMQTWHPHYFQNKFLVQGVEPGVRLDHVPNSI
jgi:hypothetical protein